MPRKSLKNEITGKLKSYLELKILKSPTEQLISISKACRDLGCSRNTLYKYGLDQMISQAVKEQTAHAKKTGQIIEKDYYKSTIADLKNDLAQEKLKVNNLQMKVVLMDMNCSRLGIDPEELIKEPVKADRSMSRAGHVKRSKFRR